MQHGVVFADPYSYCAHPDAIRLRDGSIAMVFNRGPRRKAILHPPQDPMFTNVVTRSKDNGATWSVPQVAPDYGWNGTECAGLTELPDGRVMLNQFRGNWIPLAKARRMPLQAQMTWPAELLARNLLVRSADDTEIEANPEMLAPWCRNGGRTWAHYSSDGGLSYDDGVEIVTKPYVGGYGYHGGAVRADGRILLPLTDAYIFRTIFLVTSDDAGRNWSAPQHLVSQVGSEFEEPATLVCRSGKIIMILRDNGLRRLHQIDSTDGGRTWSPLRRLEIEGFPAHLAQLDGGRILMTYGWRQPGFGIRARWSGDEGATWSEQEILIRTDMANSNLGYPCTLPGDGGAMLTLYYGEDGDGTTAILNSRWTMPNA